MKQPQTTLFAAIVLSLSMYATAETNTAVSAKQEAPKTPAIEELVSATLDGKTEAITAAIKNGFDPNAVDQQGRCLMMYAAFNGHTETVKALIAAGAQVDKTDSTGSTALMFASSGPFTKTVELLLENGAEINRVDNNEHFSALMWAAAEGQAENVKLLVKKGADLSLKDKDGDTAESFAAQRGQTAVVELLKQAAAEKAPATATEKPAEPAGE